MPRGRPYTLRRTPEVPGRSGERRRGGERRRTDRLTKRRRPDQNEGRRHPGAAVAGPGARTSSLPLPEGGNDGRIARLLRRQSAAVPQDGGGHGGGAGGGRC